MDTWIGVYDFFFISLQDKAVAEAVVVLKEVEVEPEDKAVSEVELVLKVVLAAVDKEVSVVEPVDREVSVVELVLKEDSAVEPVVKEDTAVEPVVKEDTAVEQELVEGKQDSAEERVDKEDSAVEQELVEEVLKEVLKEVNKDTATLPPENKCLFLFKWNTTNAILSYLPHPSKNIPSPLPLVYSLYCVTYKLYLSIKKKNCKYFYRMYIIPLILKL